MNIAVFHVLLWDVKRVECSRGGQDGQRDVGEWGMKEPLMSTERGERPPGKRGEEQQEVFLVRQRWEQIERLFPKVNGQQRAFVPWERDAEKKSDNKRFWATAERRGTRDSSQKPIKFKGECCKEVNLIWGKYLSWGARVWGVESKCEGPKTTGIFVGGA